LSRPRIAAVFLAVCFVTSTCSAWQRNRRPFGPPRTSDRWYDYQCFDQLSAVEARTKCEQTLAARLELLQQSVDLSDDQRDKLLVAGQTDIHRFFARQQDSKRRRSEVDDNHRRETREINREFALGLHDAQSLFAKTQRSSFDRQQLADASEARQSRARFLYQKHIEITLAVVDTALPLTIAQRRQVTETLLTETVPPEEYGSGIGPVFAVLVKMSQIRDKLEPMFAANEWKVMKQIMGRGIVSKGIL